MIQKIRWSVLGVLLAIAVSVVAQSPVGPVPGGIVGAPVAITPSASGSGANALATYLVASATNAPINAINVGPAANKVIGGTTPSAITITSAYVDTSIALTGVDINTSNQVTATHLAAALPIAQGGTAATAQRALTTAQPADQIGNATATLKMNGLGAAAAPCTITPVATGRVLFTVLGSLKNTVAADAINYNIAVGTGTAPANAASVTGTVITTLQGSFLPTGGQASFSISGVATGLSLSTAVWYDLQISNNVGGTAAVSNVTCTALEI